MWLEGTLQSFSKKIGFLSNVFKLIRPKEANKLLGKLFYILRTGRIDQMKCFTGNHFRYQ